MRDEPSDASQTAAALPPASEALVASREPADLPGVEHVMYLHDRVYTGGVPEGDAGFDALCALNVRTIVAVDASTPDVGRARARGMRYVHIPIEYAGVSTDERLELAHALRDLPRPIYVHCHHGEHRAPTAAALALVSLGEMTPSEGVDAMRRAGTSPSYPGLYRCVEQAGQIEDRVLRAHEPVLPEIAEPESFTAAMAEIDRAWYRIQGVRANGWVVPSDHPDLVPAALAGRMEVLLRSLADDGTVHDDADGGAMDAVEFVRLMRESAEASGALEAALGTNDTTAHERLYQRVAASCRACHVEYRNDG